MTIIDKLGYGKVCAHLVPQMLSDVHEKIRKTISTDLLWHTTMVARVSCCRLLLVTKPSSTIMNLTPSGNCWNDTKTSPSTKKFNSAVSWKTRSYSLCYSWQLLTKWAIVNSNRHADTLKNLNAHLHRAHTQETCLTCRSYMTTLSCTQVGMPQKPSSEIVNGQCCHIHPKILTLLIRLLPTSILSSGRKPARTPLHQWWGTA